VRIVLNGQQAFGEAVLKALLDRGEEVVAVYCAPDAPGQRPDPLKAAAEARGLPVVQPKSFKDPAVAEAFRTWKPDLAVMAYVTKIVPSSVLGIPALGTIQYHPSLLPRHRGPCSINWPIIQGETRTGLTVFWPDEGLDTGPILLQKEVAIGPDDTLGSLYFDRLFPMGVEAMLEAVDLVRAGTAPRIPQDEAQATYEGWCRAEDVRIDWSRPAASIYALIRGANPQPGAWTELHGKRVQVFETHRVPKGSGAEPGTVVSIDTDGMRVAAGDGDLLIERVRTSGSKAAAAELVDLLGLAPGMRLG